MNDYQIFYLQEYGGVSRYHIELAKAINRINDLRVAFPSVLLKNIYLCEYKNQRIRNHLKNKTLRKIEKSIEKYANILINCLYARKADIVHITWYMPYLYFGNKGKIVVTIHDMIHELYFPKTAEKEIKNKKKAIYNSDCIIAVSENTKKDIMKFYPDIPENKIKVIYHGTNQLPMPQRPELDLKAAGYVLYVGRRGSYKGSDFMIKALEKVIKDYNLLIVFVGGDCFTNEEEKTLNEIGIAERVIQYNASDSELSYLYQHALCFIYPSIYEGFGFPILEAFNNDCPVICTKSSSLPEVGGEAALYFNEGDGETLSKLVKSLLFNLELRETCVKKGREQIKQFSWEKCAKETYKVYSEICGEIK